MSTRSSRKCCELQFELIPSNNTWHSDILGFQVNDRESGESMGILYLDLHPRLGKYSHADCFPLQPGYRLVSGEYQKPVVAILANFSKRYKICFFNNPLLFAELNSSPVCLNSMNWSSYSMNLVMLCTVCALSPSIVASKERMSNETF